jgi:hypothetical protein
MKAIPTLKDCGYNRVEFAMSIRQWAEDAEVEIKELKEELAETKKSVNLLHESMTTAEQRGIDKGKQRNKELKEALQAVDKKLGRNQWPALRIIKQALLKDS